MSFRETLIKVSFGLLLAVTVLTPDRAFAGDIGSVPYDVEVEAPSSATLTWKPQVTAFASQEISRQKSAVSSYVHSLKDKGGSYLTAPAIKKMRAKYPALQITNKPCNFTFVFFDFASWARSACEFKYVDAKQYLLAAMKAFLNRNPGYNSTEDYLEVVSALEEISTKHWDYRIQNGWFSCPKQIAMGTYAGFPMESKWSPTVRALRVTKAPANKWQFSVKVLARDFKTLAANAKVSQTEAPYGIEFNNY